MLLKIIIFATFLNLARAYNPFQDSQFTKPCKQNETYSMFDFENCGDFDLCVNNYAERKETYQYHECAFRYQFEDLLAKVGNYFTVNKNKISNGPEECKSYLEKLQETSSIVNYYCDLDIRTEYLHVNVKYAGLPDIVKNDDNPPKSVLRKYCNNIVDIDDEICGSFKRILDKSKDCHFEKALNRLVMDSWQKCSNKHTWTN